MTGQAFALAVAEYPKMAPYPNEMDYLNPDGTLDFDRWSADHDAWRDDRNAQQNEPGHLFDGIHPIPRLRQKTNRLRKKSDEEERKRQANADEKENRKNNGNRFRQRKTDSSPQQRRCARRRQKNRQNTGKKTFGIKTAVRTGFDSPGKSDSQHIKH